MYYKTLYSPEISALSDKILQWVNGHLEYVWHQLAYYNQI
jgi:hypothetical protein